MNKSIIKNPLTESIKNSVDSSSNCLNIAVPFISSFVRKILSQENTKKIIDKRIITRFDDSYIHSFDLDSFQLLIDLGFILKFDNNIHLKLYVTDDEAFVSSSNFTKGGFENNVELTVRVDQENKNDCRVVFEDIWKNCGDNFITSDLILQNWAKYELLKRRYAYSKKNVGFIKTEELGAEDFDVQEVIEAIFMLNKDYSNLLGLEYEANKLRERFKRKLMQRFDSELFYLPEGHPERKETLFYDFSYGFESKIAGTGLRESHFQSVFQSSHFEKVINYMYPEILGMKSWNLKDEEELKEFCNGILDFEIPSYKESIPLRLASYFYPDVFLPIFKISHLKEICDAFGFITDAETNGDRIYVFTTFLKEKMKLLPCENVIKGDIAYQVRFTIDLFNRLNNNESFEEIIRSQNKLWIKGFYEEGRSVLSNLKKKK